MSHLFRVVPMALLALTGTARAQMPDVDAAPEGAVMATPPSDETPMPVQGGTPGQLNADGVYTIEGGDTLWDLSQQFLNNPWYWPKIWADNPYVDNPHWIYPGNQLRIRFNAEGLPAEVIVEAPVEEPLPQKPAEVAAFTTGTVHSTDTLGQASDLVSIAGRGQISLMAPGQLRTRVSSIVTSRELAETGVIDSSFEQKELLATFDRAYVRFNDGTRPSIGDKFSVFRTSTEIIHPITHDSWGYQSKIMGTLRIVALEADVAVAEIGDVTDYIVRGDRVGPAAELDKVVSPVPNTLDLTAVVLATEIPNQQEIGESHVVFIDRGSQDGVVEGNTFTIVHSGDGLDRLSIGDNLRESEAAMPMEPVATLMVFDVRDDASAAMVVKSLREVKVGDTAMMRAATPLLGMGGEF